MGKKQYNKRNERRHQSAKLNYWLVQTSKRNQQKKSKSGLQNRKVIQWHLETAKKLQVPTVDDKSNDRDILSKSLLMDQRDDRESRLEPPAATTARKEKEDPLIGTFIYLNKCEIPEEGSNSGQGPPDQPLSVKSGKLEQQLASLEQRIADLEQDTADLKQRIADLEQETDDLKQETDDLKQETADLKHRIDGLIHQNAVQRLRMAKCDRLIGDLQQEFADQEQEMEENDLDIAFLKRAFAHAGLEF